MVMKRVISIGNFDGVHRGHQALIQRARAIADQHDVPGGRNGGRDSGRDGGRGGGAQVCVLTFDPPPIRILRPEVVVERLANRDDKIAWLREAGADEVRVIEPTADMLAMSPTAYIEQLVHTLNPIAMVEGDDFRFGHKRAGDMDLLRELGQQHGFEVATVEPVMVHLDSHHVAPVGSSVIRTLVQLGRVADAMRLLGKPYALTAPVVRGEQRGRELGFPTINLDSQAIEGYVMPMLGVYAGDAQLADGSHHPAAISVGVKPTFAGEMPSPVIEAHLLNYAGDLYDQTVRLSLMRWLRDQTRFDGITALREQLARDVAATERFADTGLLNPSQPPIEPIIPMPV